MIPRILTITLIAAAALLLYSYASGIGYLGEPQARGQIHQQPLPKAVITNTQQQRQSAAANIGVRSDKQILFGDLHVHTTWSNDAYFASLPLAGGLVAVHAVSRKHEDIWQALQQKETYGTSGDRILRWFDLLNPDPSSDAIAPMGSELHLGHQPQFRVRAVGAFQQKPGCPDHSIAALSEQRLQRLCYGECYNPSDRRKLITRIEVVRIRPQMTPNENVASLIEDNGLVHHCPADENGCSFEFRDPDLIRNGRESVYDVRAIEESSDAVNAALMRCQYDDNGQCASANICSASPLLTPSEEDCLAPNEERAWSSPIFIDFQARESALNTTAELENIAHHSTSQSETITMKIGMQPITAAQAADEILQGITANGRSIIFPRLNNVILRLHQRIPATNAYN